MTEQEKLEWAAKACGYEIVYRCSPPKTTVHIKDGESSKCWNPLTDQADSDRMACKLRMSTRISLNDVFCVVELPRPITAYVAHNNTDEDVCRAVREARLLVAVEIGRGR